MNTHDQTPEPPVRGIDRFLAYAAITLVAVAVACFVAIIIGTVVKTDFGTPVWTVVSALTMYGLPLGILLFFVLLIMNMVRRSRAATAARGVRKR